MRLGLLSRYNDPPINGHMIPQPGNLPDIHRTSHPQGSNGNHTTPISNSPIVPLTSSLSCFAEPPASIANQFAWHSSGEMHMSVPGQGSVSIDTRNHNKDNEDVEVMSTDSSSSSSSDSQ